MKFEDIDGANWPVAEPGDFDTHDGDEKFALMEDENGGMYFGYGHVDPEKFIAELRRYLDHLCLGDYDDPFPDDVKHVYAKFSDTYAERFSWDGVTAETAHSWPLTVVMY